MKKAKITRRRKVQMGITAISLEGYKSINSKIRIEINQLTVIAGVNSSGKSSSVQPLLLLKQTLESPFDPGPLLLDGPNVSVTSIDQILTKAAKRKPASESFSIGVEINGRETGVRFGRDPLGGLKILEYSGWIFPGQEAAAILKEGMSVEAVRKLVPAEVMKIYKPVIDGLESDSTSFYVDRDRFSLVPVISWGEELGNLQMNLGGQNDIENEVSRIIHLPALRGNPLRTYRMAAVEGRYPGTFDTYTAGIIASWQKLERKEKIKQLKEDLEELGLTWKVEAVPIDDTRVELMVGRLPKARQGGAWDLVNIADVGFGVSQTLPVVVALLAAQPGQVVYLEQPEIHLHPRAQVKFGELVKRAMDRGVKVVVETHSSLFIRSIQTLVAKDDIPSNSVSLHWFARNPIDGYTKVNTAKLDSFGSFGDWPEDFDEVIMDSESEYLDAVAEKGDY